MSTNRTLLSISSFANNFFNANFEDIVSMSDK